jgi:hypothetical protein
MLFLWLIEQWLRAFRPRLSRARTTLASQAELVMTERSTALRVWVGLVLVFVISSLIAFGLNSTMLRLRPGDWSNILFTNAFFLFVIGATDYPERIRKSSVLRI